jgi:hypothetical protein
MKKNSSLITARVPIGAHFLIIDLVLALFALLTTSSLWADDPPVAAANAAKTTQATAEARAAYANLPLSFVPNAGQLDTRVRYTAQSGPRSFYFTTHEAVFSFATKSQGLVLRLGFLGANPGPAITSQAARSGTVNYLIGNDPARWHTNLLTYGEIVYRDLWPGIDLLFRGDSGKLTYEFSVKPGARVKDIRLAYRGAKKLSVDKDGNLMIHTSLGNISDTHPTTYQWIDGKRVEVPSRFALNRRSKTTYGFTVGAYDRRQPLVVDPGLVYSTYLGGSGDDEGEAIAVDSAGQAYVAGTTRSADFPTTSGAFQSAYNGGEDVFITKFNRSGSAQIYSTYLGGKTNDEPYWSASIVVDHEGYAYVAGTTWSSDFPTTPGAFQTTLKGEEDAFVTKLNRDGSGLVYSTYLGGSTFTGAYYADAIAVDPAGYAYVTGFTDSPDFPTVNAFQSTLKGPEDAFVTKLNRTGTALVYSTYLGGSDYDDATGIAVDGGGKAVVTGFTYSTDFPTENAYQSMNHGAANAFITKLNSDGNALIYSTYLGGSGFDAAASVALDWPGDAYVAGDAGSTDFPTTPGAYQTTYGGGADDVFVAKFTPSGALAYSTFLGGALDDYANNITVDPAGQAYVTGFTNSPVFPTTPDAYDMTFNGAGPLHFYGDAFVTKLNSSGSGLIYSTYFGGSGDDLGLGIAIDPSRKVFITGATSSTDLPTTSGAFDMSYNGAGAPYFYGDAFVAKFDVPPGAEGCHKGDGDGNDDDGHGRTGHHHFHKKPSCNDPDDTENDNVSEDDSHGSHFQSTAFTSSTFNIVDGSQTITIVGSGLHNGLPVTFTMVAINYGDVAPGVFNLTLSDGYTFIGTIVNGTIDIQ